MSKLRLARWDCNLGIDARASASKPLPVCWQTDAEPRARLWSPKLWWAVWAGLLERSSEQTVTPPENSDFGSQTQGLPADELLGALLTWQVQRRTCFQSSQRRDLSSPLQPWTPLHLCTHLSSSKQDGCVQHLPALAQSGRSA